MTEKQPKNWRPATKAIHADTVKSQFGDNSPAIALTSGFAYDNAHIAEQLFKQEREGFVYSRYTNPTVSVFEKRMATLEGADMAMATASGMAAVNASLMCQLATGDHIVAAKALFSSCRYIIETILPKFGVEFTLVDGSDYEQWQAAIRKNTKVLFLETPANPLLEVIDIAKVAAIAHDNGACLIVDNVFATPFLQQPLKLGADVVVYSATKHIDGQGRCLGGVVIGQREFIEDKLQNFLRHTGPALSPFNAWVMLKGLETLPLRIKAMTQTATKIADHFADHPQLEFLYYPWRSDHPQYDVARRQMLSGSNMIAFAIKGDDKDKTFKVVDALQVITISNNLGDVKSLITHPATTTHQRLSAQQRLELGINDGLVRLSVGLEDVDDLIEDITQALDII